MTVSPWLLTREPEWKLSSAVWRTQFDDTCRAILAALIAVGHLRSQRRVSSGAQNRFSPAFLVKLGWTVALAWRCPTSGPLSDCEPLRQVILAKVEQGLSVPRTHHTVCQYQCHYGAID